MVTTVCEYASFPDVRPDDRMYRLIWLHSSLKDFLLHAQRCSLNVVTVGITSSSGLVRAAPQRKRIVQMTDVHQWFVSTMALWPREDNRHLPDAKITKTAFGVKDLSHMSSIRCRWDCRQDNRMAENAMGVTEMRAATSRGRSLCASSGQQDLWRHDSHVK